MINSKILYVILSNLIEDQCNLSFNVDKSFGQNYTLVCLEKLVSLSPMKQLIGLGLKFFLAYGSMFTSTKANILI